MTGETPENKTEDIIEAVVEAAVEVFVPVVAIEALFDLYRHDVTGKAHHMWVALHDLVAKAKEEIAAHV